MKEQAGGLGPSGLVLFKGTKILTGYLCCENQSGSKKTIGLEGKVKAAPKRQLSTTEAHRLLVDVQAGAGISAGLMVYKGVPIVFGYTRGSSIARINREKKSTSVPKKDLT